MATSVSRRSASYVYWYTFVTPSTVSVFCTMRPSLSRSTPAASYVMSAIGVAEYALVCRASSPKVL